MAIVNKFAFLNRINSQSLCFSFLQKFSILIRQNSTNYGTSRTNFTRKQESLCDFSD